MRPLPWIAAEPFRWSNAPRNYGSSYGDDFGFFLVPHAPTNVTLKVMVSSGMGWEHVSVSLERRCPNWPEMDFVKRMFWRDDEAVMQLHPPRADHRSIHPYCLHMWRPTDTAIPLPPGWMVGNETDEQWREMDAALSPPSSTKEA